ncbi:MAG: hypothetical protein KIT72_10985 [Polyangiaceae bacterium]|nr:hypothetical protein [Polyangiaceae bacterium]MCW5790935.1 hypothetical protein [Polyangiaceae bacterium]
MNRNAIRGVLFALILVASGLGLRNSLGEPQEAIDQADALICGAPGCPAQLVRWERGPFSHVRVYQEAPGQPRTIEIRCQRSYVLLGDYACVNQTPKRP